MYHLWRFFRLLSIFFCPIIGIFMILVINDFFYISLHFYIFSKVCITIKIFEVYNIPLFLDRTWICEICSKISNSYKAHWKHRTTHKLLDFSCEFCEFQSTTRKVLNSHEREVHGLVSFNDFLAA